MSTTLEPIVTRRSRATSTHLRRVLGVPAGTAIVIGSMIGSAIFVVPAQITRELGSSASAIAVWFVAGIVSFLGALCFAELSAMLPQAGGQYVFLREAYGSMVGFLCGWIFLFAAQTGGISALAMGLTGYVDGFVPLSGWQQRMVASLVIAALTAINYRGIRMAGRLQVVLTSIIVGLMVALILLGYAFHPPNKSVAALSPPKEMPGLESIGIALAAALWAYDGWNSIAFASGEVKRPERNLPLILLIGTGSVIALYVGINCLYYHVLPLADISHSPRVAAEVATRTLGPRGSALVSLVIVVAAFGSANVSVLGGARVYYAMANDGLFFSWCAAVHPRFRSPHLALLAQAAWAIVLVCLASYEELLAYTVFVAWAFYALAACGLIVLRHKHPNWSRPYRVFGYPWTPAIFVIVTTLFVLNIFLSKPAESACGCLLIALGVPAYYFSRKRWRSNRFD